MDQKQKYIVKYRNDSDIKLSIIEAESISEFVADLDDAISVTLAKDQDNPINDLVRLERRQAIEAEDIDRLVDSFEFDAAFLMQLTYVGKPSEYRAVFDGAISEFAKHLKEQLK